MEIYTCCSTFSCSPFPYSPSHSSCPPHWTLCLLKWRLLLQTHFWGSGKIIYHSQKLYVLTLKRSML